MLPGPLFAPWWIVTGKSKGSQKSQCSNRLNSPLHVVQAAELKVKDTRFPICYWFSILSWESLWEKRSHTFLVRKSRGRHNWLSNGEWRRDSPGSFSAFSCPSREGHTDFRQAESRQFPAWLEDAPSPQCWAPPHSGLTFEFGKLFLLKCQTS